MRSPVAKTFATAGVAGMLTAPLMILTAAAAETGGLQATLPGQTSFAHTVHRAVKERELGRTVRLARLVARERGERLRPGYRGALRTFTVAQLLREQREERRALRELRQPVSPVLEAIANCESHGNPRAIGGGGAYRGKYQMSYATWAAVGGKGDPAAAPEAEQDRRAALLYARAGASQWPVCGR